MRLTTAMWAEIFYGLPNTGAQDALRLPREGEDSDRVLPRLGSA